MLTAASLPTEEHPIQQKLSWSHVLVAFLAIFSLSVPAALGQCPASSTCWAGGVTGVWSSAPNWSNGVPSSSLNVFIDHGRSQASSVTLDVNGAANQLSIDINDALGINNARVLTVNGNSINNAGKLTMNSTGSFTELVIGSSAVTLSGGGSLTMSNNANNLIFGAATADTLNNKETIQGAGNIGHGRMTLVNSGTINANQSAGLTIQANGGTTNTGTIKATGGTLDFFGTAVNNTGGTISAAGQTLQVTSSTINGGTVTLTGAANLQLSNGTIHSGSTLNNSATGTIEVLAGSNTLGGTINNPAGGVIKVDNNTLLNLENGSYPKLGSVTLNSTGNFTELQLTGANVTLSGGSVTMSNNANNLIFGAATADILNNKETIQGAGNIGHGRMTLVNSGTINANQSAGLTIQANGGTTNTGTIKATGGTLDFFGTTVNNTGGTISASGQTLQVTSSTINGGTVTLTGAANLQLSNGTIHSGSTLNNSATGTIEVLAGSNTLGGTVNNPAGGVIKVDNNTLLNLENGSYPKLGSVTLNSTGNFTELQVNGANVTLSGGSVTMSNNANNLIFGAATADTLTNQETIQGAGNIGHGRMTLVNSGTINANQSAGLTIQANGGTTNTGTIKATGGTLDFFGTTVTNTGGAISAAGRTLQVTSSTINGGTVTLTGASNLQLSNGTIHSGSTLNNSATGTIEVLAGSNTLGGTINNPAGGVIKVDNNTLLNLENGSYPKLGSVTLNSTGNFTELQLTGANVTLSGGSVTMSNNANNLIFGAATADILNNKETIQGAGNIGHGRMTLVNSGTINANQSAGLTIQANGGTTNTGTIKATGGTLDFFGTTVNNTGGTISASGQTLQVTSSTINGGTVTLTGAANLQLSNGTIHSGSTLNNSATGTIEVLAGSNTLGGTVNNPAGGVIKVDNNTLLNLENGSYPKLGSVTLNSTGNFTELQVNGANVTLSGGSVTMSNNANNLIFGAATADTLTNQETIQGAGNIGHGRMTLVNSGTINANQSAGLTIQANGGFNNQGTLSVSSGDLMHVFGGPFSNFSGTTLTGGTYNVTGTLKIDQLGSTGGEIVTNKANISLNGGASSFVDAAGKDALTKLNANATGSAFTITGGRNFTTLGNFTNNGTLTVGSGNSKFTVNGNLGNFNSTTKTLMGGTYNLTGTLQFNGANIVTNAGKITLNGASSQIINQTSVNALANFATNAAAGSFTLMGGRSLSTAGSNFTNAGLFTVAAGSTFTVGNGGSSSNAVKYTQTGGVTQIDGTLTAAASASQILNLNVGSLFGTGTLAYGVVDGGTVSPGDSVSQTGLLAVSKTYTQSSGGALSIAIGGLTVGSKYDRLNVTSSASLNGQLNISLVNGFVPTVGSSFDILHAGSRAGTFSAVTGLSINGTEHFTVTYNATDVLLTVASGAAFLGHRTIFQRPGGSAAGSGFLMANLQAMRNHYSPLQPASLRGPQIQVAPVRQISGFARSFGGRPLAGPRAAGKLAGLVLPQTVTGSISLAAGPANALPMPRNLGMPSHKTFAYHLNVLPLLGANRRTLLRDLLKQPGSANATPIGYLTIDNSN